MTTWFHKYESESNMKSWEIVNCCIYVFILMEGRDITDVGFKSSFIYSDNFRSKNNLHTVDVRQPN